MNHQSNEYGVALYDTGWMKEIQGGALKRDGLKMRAKAYCQMLDVIIKDNDGERPRGKALASALEEQLNRPLDGPLADKRERAALEWFHNNPEQVGMVDAETPFGEEYSVRTLQNKWNALLKKTVRDETADGRSAADIADEMHVSESEVQAIIDKPETKQERAGDDLPPSHGHDPNEYVEKLLSDVYLLAGRIRNDWEFAKTVAGQSARFEDVGVLTEEIGIMLEYIHTGATGDRFDPEADVERYFPDKLKSGEIPVDEYARKEGQEET